MANHDRNLSPIGVCCGVGWEGNGYGTRGGGPPVDEEEAGEEGELCDGVLRRPGRLHLMRGPLYDYIKRETNGGWNPVKKIRRLDQKNWTT